MAEPTPSALGTDVRALVDAWTGFALDLFHGLGSGEENLVLSPSSVATVLAMVLPGARGLTASETAAVLHSDLDPERLASAAGTLDASLTGRTGEDDPDLRISNAVWVQERLTLLPELVGLLEEAFHAGLRQVDFRRDPEGARRAINGLVAEQTAGRIPELFEAGAIDTDSRLVLTNAIYLEARWQVAFDPSDTWPEPFHRLRSGTGGATGSGTTTTTTGATGSGTTTEVDMLHRQARFGYARGDGWRAVELPYRGGRLVMDVIVPEDGGFSSFQAGLEAGRLGELLASLRPREVRLALPKFTFDSALDLRGPLQALGMRTAFSETADFSGITEDEDLQVDRVVQQAHIEVDERGTTAAAATGATVRLVSAVMPTSPVELRVDRPFLFAVRDRASGALLFLGRVTDPSA